MEDTNQNLNQSFSGLYAKLIQERQNKQEEKEAKKKEKELEDNEIEETKESKQAKREKALESWKEVITNITGDDIEYIKPKKNKKKYRKWIDEDIDVNRALTEKPKKRKKINYNKQFEQEINMLKSILSEQNKFTQDISKRFQTMVGPNTKDAHPMNKTTVDLASVVNNARSNSLALLREIGNIKNTIARLTHEERKLDARSGGDFDSTDPMLLGSAIARQEILANPTLQPVSQAPSPFSYEEYDPSSWSSDSVSIDPHTKYEKTPVKTYLEYNKATGDERFKTINTETGEELLDYPNPNFSVKHKDLDNKLARDDFNHSYEIIII